MFRRLFWLFLGVGVGLGSSLWVTRPREAGGRPLHARARVERPGRAPSQGLGRDVRLAVHEGREAMREREAELRADVQRSVG